MGFLPKKSCLISHFRSAGKGSETSWPGHFTTPLENEVLSPCFVLLETLPSPPNFPQTSDTPNTSAVWLVSDCPGQASVANSLHLHLHAPFRTLFICFCLCLCTLLLDVLTSSEAARWGDAPARGWARFKAPGKVRGNLWSYRCAWLLLPGSNTGLTPGLLCPTRGHPRLPIFTGSCPVLQSQLAHHQWSPPPLDSCPSYGREPGPDFRPVSSDAPPCLPAHDALFTLLSLRVAHPRPEMSLRFPSEGVSQSLFEFPVGICTHFFAVRRENSRPRLNGPLGTEREVRPSLGRPLVPRQMKSWARGPLFSVGKAVTVSILISARIASLTLIVKGVTSRLKLQTLDTAFFFFSLESIIVCLPSNYCCGGKPSLTAGGSGNAQPPWKTVRRPLKKLTAELPYDPAMLLLGVHTPQTENIYSQRDMYALPVHCSVIRGGRDVETAEVAFGEWIQKTWASTQGKATQPREEVPHCRLRQHSWALRISR